jgi:hypothetical protein
MLIHETVFVAIKFFFSVTLYFCNRSQFLASVHLAYVFLLSQTSLRSNFRSRVSIFSLFASDHFFLRLQVFTIFVCMKLIIALTEATQLATIQSLITVSIILLCFTVQTITRLGALDYIYDRDRSSFSLIWWSYFEREVAT